MKKAFLLLFVTSILGNRLIAQVSVKDSSIYTPLVGVSYGYYMPSGDFKNRFGNNSSVMLNVDFKTRKDWTWGLNGSYFFCKDIKESLFDSIIGSDGSIINSKGEISDIRLFERGFTVSVTFGRIFSFKKPNPNSGILLNVGLGFIQHKIRIETIGNNVPQLSKEYKKGYDRLSNGLLLSENLGYLFLSNNRLQNFYVGLECMQGFTQSSRSFDFETMHKDSQK